VREGSGRKGKRDREGKERGREKGKGRKI